MRIVSDVIINVESLGKKYQISHEQQKGGARYTALRDVLTEKARGFRRMLFSPQSKSPEDMAGRSKTEDFWALRGCTYKIKQGERVGIIGRNGAGKTTMLKLLSRITEPTEGRIHLKGRVASLLEVGTGFHPELTGKENVFLNGAIMGITRQQINRKFDEIVAFAEVEKFIDTPMKRYSSGMQVRLAFAIAAHLEQEILLVDEVLAVGDAAFQKKCLIKMDSVAQEGRTVVFVSHQLGQVSALCTRAIRIHQGRIVQEGPVQEVIDSYIESFKDIHQTTLRDRTDRQGNGWIRAVDTWVEDENGARVQHVISGKLIKLVIQYEVPAGEKVSNVLFGFGIMNSVGVFIASIGPHLIGKLIDVGPKPGRVECIIPKLNLNSGMFTYSVMIRSGKSGNEIIDYIKDVNTFTVEPGDFYGTGMIPGNVLMNIDYKYEVVEDSP